ncbi:MAG: molecular chaperone SurA [Gammaproteobacteria bacterium]|nr:MAG: molecular chaperone SurA [Gammaproteobacteria bacterium]
MKFVTRLFIFLSLLINSNSLLALQTLDRIVAVVNDNVITHQELLQRIEDFKQQLSQRNASLPPDDIMQKQVLERMIVDEIQLQLAQSQGIQIDDLALNRMLESIAQRNRATLDEMRKRIEADGMDFNSFREQTRKDMMIGQVQQRMVFSRIQVSSQEIDQFLELQKQTGAAASDRYHLAHILIATPEAATPEDIARAFDKAEKVVAHLKAGESFTEVAQRFSEGRQALEGGDLGWRSAAELPTIFVEALRALNKGDISPPLRSASGFHIVKLLDKQTQQHIVQQTHARHILIKTDAITTDEQARQQLLDIKQRLAKGEDFAKLASEFSQDPGSKLNGGDLGWSTAGSFVPQFEQVMNSLGIKQISEPFRSQFGWHIVQVLERRQQDETEQLKRSTAERAIQQRKADEELQLWLRRIRDEAYVEYRDGNNS